MHNTEQTSHSKLGIAAKEKCQSRLGHDVLAWCTWHVKYALFLKGIFVSIMQNVKIVFYFLGANIGS